MSHALGAAAPERMGNRNPAWAPHGLFPAAGDDQWISIVCVNDDQWHLLADLVGAPLTGERFSSLAARKKHEEEIEQHLGEYTQQQGAWELAERLQTLGIPAYPSLTCPEIETNQQLVARGFWEHFDHPEVGVRTHSGVPWLTHNAANGVMSRAPLLGEHTAEVLEARR